MQITDAELDDLRTWWCYAFALQAHVDAHPDDREARLMLGTFVRWLLARPEWLRVAAVYANVMPTSLT